MYYLQYLLWSTVICAPRDDWRNDYLKGNAGPIAPPVGQIGRSSLYGDSCLMDLDCKAPGGPWACNEGTGKCMRGVKTVADVLIGESENGESENGELENGESDNGESESGGSALNATAIRDLLPVSSACLTKSGTDPGKPCVAPFIYNLTVFTGCTLKFSTDSKPWCATQVDDNGAVLVGKTGKCDLTCPMASVDMGGWTGPEDGGSESTSEGPESKDDEAGAESISEGPESENDEADSEGCGEGVITVADVLIGESENGESGSGGPELNATAIKDLLPVSSACITKSGKDPGKPCVAPFIYNLTVFTGCTLKFATDSKPWCATQVDDYGVALVGKTGKCDLTCPMATVDMGEWTGSEEAGSETTSVEPETEDDEARYEGFGEGKSGSEYYASDAAAGEPENDSHFYTNKMKNQNHKGYYKNKQQSNASSGYYEKKKKEEHNFYSNYYAKKKKEEENKNYSGYYAKKKKEEYYGSYYAKKKEEESKHYSDYYAKKRKEKYHNDYYGKAKTYVLTINL